LIAGKIASFLFKSTNSRLLLPVLTGRWQLATFPGSAGCRLQADFNRLIINALWVAMGSALGQRFNYHLTGPPSFLTKRQRKHLPPGAVSLQQNQSKTTPAMRQAIVTLTFFRYQGFAARWWAFRQMGLAPGLLPGLPGLRFGKMLGSGGGKGFSIWPDFGTYGLLAVWEDEVAAQAFFDRHPLYAAYRQRCSAWWTVYMQAAKAHGQWDGQEPFPSSVPFDENRLVGVITRATIHPRHLLRFWRFVPSASRSIQGREGLLFAVGIGELPIVQQATFSLWENSRLMQQYAYRSPHHKEVVRRTRELGWYKEELFARFHPYRSEGEWGEGGTPLEGVL
jgi:hypothetical protein